MGWAPKQPATFLHEVLEPLRPLLARNEHELVTQCDEALAVLWGDHGLLTRLLQNLVGNAIKFTPRGGQIVVGINRAPAGNTIELRVRDSGPGIAAAALPYIFDRYYQAPADDRRDGNGLGLYFCRLVSEAHGGQIRAASQLGGGTTVTVVLPVRPPQD
ncbi:MAG: ATP-binding protein [Chloroflexales bacterium]|nr:ATP-binding protein [Chloroflexales bacterium]